MTIFDLHKVSKIFFWLSQSKQDDNFFDLPKLSKIINFFDLPKSEK